MYLEKKHVKENKYVQLCYWRKANQIRNWFDTHLENGVENCEYVKIEKEDLEELMDTCRKVLEDHSLAEELLPTQSGFFFGPTSYNEWYFEDLENTIETLEEAFTLIDWDNEEVFYYEWW